MTARLLPRSASILLIWLAATAPMAVLAWGVAPRLMTPGDPMPGLVFWHMIIIGMAWQTVLSLIVLKLEGVPFRIADLRERLWLQAPIWRPTGSRFLAAYLLVPVFLAIGLFGDQAVSAWFGATPVGRQLAEAVPDFAFLEGLAVPEARGRWDILALALLSCLFNYGLGEALLFHGILLPRMEQAWGRWAWVGNGLLFTAYHVHKFWLMPGLVISCLCNALPAQVFRSNWLAVWIHGLEGVALLVMVFLVVR